MSTEENNTIHKRVIAGLCSDRKMIEEIQSKGRHVLKHKIDFAIIMTVKNANPNGDPANNNMPRMRNSGIGYMTPECIKRKMLNVAIDDETRILNQADDRRTANDIFDSIESRARSCPELQDLWKEYDKKKADPVTKEALRDKICSIYFDARMCGSVLAFAKKGEDTAVALSIKAPLSVQDAESLEPIDVSFTKITRATNANVPDEGKSKGKDTMGDRYTVDWGVYVCRGTINAVQAEKTGFSAEDAAYFKTILPRVLLNDESAARPGGSMAVRNVVWWEHDCRGGGPQSMTVHNSLHVTDNGDETVSVSVDELPGVTAEIIEVL